MDHNLLSVQDHVQVSSALVLALFSVSLHCSPLSAGLSPLALSVVQLVTFENRSAIIYLPHVEEHFLSDLHIESMKQIKAQEDLKEKLDTLTPNSKQYKMEHMSDGKRRLLSPVETMIVPRLVTDFQCRRGAQAMAQIPIAGIRSADTYMKDNVRMFAKRPVSATTLTRRGFPGLVEQDLQVKSRVLEGKDMWLMVDESKSKTTNDSESVTTIMIGTLEKTNVEHIMHIETSKKTPNSDEIVEMIKTGFKKVWPNGDCPRDRFKVFISDSANTMKAVGNKLVKWKILPKLTHVTCVTHALHLVCEEIRKHFKDVSEFVSLMKKVMKNSYAHKEDFRKAKNSNPSTIEMTNNKLDSLTKRLKLDPNIPDAFFIDPTNAEWDDLLISNEDALEYFMRSEIVLGDDDDDEDKDSKVSDKDKVPLPPHPVLSRFGTWLRCVCFYYHFWYRSVNFVKDLKVPDKTGKSQVAQLINLMNEKGHMLKEDIDLIYRSFSLLLVYICKLETNDLDAEEAMQTLDKAQLYIEFAAEDEEDTEGPAHKAFEKFCYVMNKNSGLYSLLDELKHDPQLSFSPITSMRIERFFSRYRRIITSQRHFSNDKNLNCFVLSSENLAKRKDQQKKRCSRQLFIDKEQAPKKQSTEPCVPKRRKKN